MNRTYEKRIKVALSLKKAREKLKINKFMRIEYGKIKKPCLYII